MEKSCKYAPNLSSRPLFILVNNPTQPLCARNSFKYKIFWKGIIKIPLKKNLLYFFFRTKSLLMDKDIKHKKDLELVTNGSSGYKTSSQKRLY